MSYTDKQLEELGKALVAIAPVVFKWTNRRVQKDETRAWDFIQQATCDILAGAPEFVWEGTIDPKRLRNFVIHRIRSLDDWRKADRKDHKEFDEEAPSVPVPSVGTEKLVDRKRALELLRERVAEDPKLSALLAIQLDGDMLTEDEPPPRPRGEAHRSGARIMSEEKKKDALDRIAETEEERKLAEELDAIEREGASEDDEKARAKMRDIVANATRPKSNVIQAAWRFRAAIAAGVVAAAAAAIVLANRAGEEDVPVASPFDAGHVDAAADAGTE